MLVTAFTAVPLGIAAGVYLEEYARKNWLTNLIEINIANLAGVPSIIYGLMALGLLVYKFRLGQSILTGGITLAFLILPIIIVATRGLSDYSAGYSRRRLRVGFNEMAGSKTPLASLLGRRNDDRRDHRPFSRNR